MMSVHNGDKSRYGRQRKRKINRRIKMRALRKATAAPAQEK
jgi:hypothetical protein